MAPMSKYAVLIRTLNSEKTLNTTIESIEKQSSKPSQYVIVDSGSTDNTIDLLPNGAIVHRYVGQNYNYSSALNQGMEHVEVDYTLIISSHTSLQNDSAMEFAISLLRGRDDLAAAYFYPGDVSREMSYRLINRHNFNGFNGIFNTCALIKTSMLRRRGFRPEVFAAEDQEWSRWVLESENKQIARIMGAGMVYGNLIKDRRMKDLYEDLAVALYVKPEMFRLPYLLRMAYRVVRPVSSWKTRAHNLRVLKNLLYYRLIGKPETIEIFYKT
jgi:glycosyltransferase involved in cell wall biosynthesis